MRPGRGGQDNNDVGQRDGLDDIMRHEDDRIFHVLPKPRQLLLQTKPRMRIQRPERFIHQQDRLVGDERPRQRPPLLHPAGQLARKLVFETAKLHPLDPLHCPAAAFGRSDAGYLQRKLDVGEQRHPGKQAAPLRHIGHAPC